MTLSKLTLLAFFATLFFIGCKPNDNKQTESKTVETENKPDSIIEAAALYYNTSFMNKAMIGWEDIQLDIPSFDDGQSIGVLDALITNPKVIEEMQQLIEALQPATDSLSLPDYRIAVTLKYKSGKTQRLGITDSHSVHQIYLNDVAQQTNNRLLYLIKNNIGFYPWLIGDNLAQQSELYDNSFLKEPFIQSYYYKEWQREQ